MSLSNAIAADRAGNLEMAAAAYEASLAAGEKNLAGFLNLAVLYWQATDFGLSTARKLDPQFVGHAGRRFPLVLAEAHRVFPESTEVQFWKKYIPWADLGEEFSLDECRGLFLRDPAALVPAMHLFVQTNGGMYRNEALELLRQCHHEGTTRGRYVASVVEGVLKRASRKQR
jgi:hypothetical protein